MGSKLWSSKCGGSRYEQGESSEKTSYGGFLTLGWTCSFGFGNNSNRDMYLIKWDSIGSFQWQKTFGTSLPDGGYGITKTLDGNYLLAGYKGVGSSIVGWVLKIDEQGNIIWQYIHPLTLTELYWARENSDGTIICAGSKSNANGKDQGWIIKLDSSGHFLWDRTFIVNNDNSYFRDVEPTPDGGYICAGFAIQGPNGTEDAWLVKLDSLGCDSVGCANYVSVEEITGGNEFEEIRLFPNPVKDFAAIIFGVEPTGRVKFEIYSVLGEKVMEEVKFSNKYLRIEVSDLSAGVYIININYDGENKSVKFVKE